MEVISIFLIAIDAHAAHYELRIIFYGEKRLRLRHQIIQSRIGIGIRLGLSMPSVMHFTQ